MKYLLFIITLAITAISCDSEKSTLTISSSAVALDGAGRPQRVVVHTNEPIWEVISEDAWPIIERDSFDVIITAASNPTRTPRSARLYIAAGNRFERVSVTQEGSLHVFGEPYPDAENPIGIIYKVSDGGEHGVIISLDQLSATTWGPEGTTHETSFTDGKASTRNIIAAHSSDPNFAIDYPAFAWVREKNGGNLDGEWYIPSFWETFEMYNFFVGNVAYVIPGGNPPGMQMNLPRPAHNLTLRDEFNNNIIAAGGDAINYAASMYWTSSESTAAQAAAVSFNNGMDYSHTAINYSKIYSAFFVRAIREF
jgi:hypothetical protein